MKNIFNKERPTKLYFKHYYIHFYTKYLQNETLVIHKIFWFNKEYLMKEK